jgi:hypothetical protein
MTKKKIQNLLVCALICATIVSMVSVENTELYNQAPIMADLQPSDMTSKFKFFTQLAELVKEVVVPTFLQ